MRRRGFDLCTRCGYWLKGLGPDQTRCPECGAYKRPHIVWFGEPVLQWRAARNAVIDADILWVIGTSLTVYPAK